MATGEFLALLEGFYLAIHILSPWYICWPLSTLYHLAVLSLPLMSQLRGVVLGGVLPLCVTPSNLTHSLQGIPLFKRVQLIMLNRAIMMYLLVATRCNYLRPVLVMVLEGGSSNSKMHPE